MWKALFLTMTLAFSSVILSGCSDEQDNQMGQDSELDADPQWSETPMVTRMWRKLKTLNQLKKSTATKMMTI